MVRDELARGAAALAAAGCESPRLDAELLLAECLGVDRARLVIGARDSVPGEVVTRYDELLARRREREPVAYILGRREFRRLTLWVDGRVLIPRPETELLVEVGLGLPSGARVADVGTGSGAVALALADERPDLSVVGIDRSADALAVARANGERLALEVSWVLGDLLPDEVECEAVLANLPYVSEGASLAPEITGWEPACALFAGSDGLALLRRLVNAVAARPSVSLVALEIGADQGDAVASLVSSAGFAVQRLRDLAGHERVLVGHRR